MQIPCATFEHESNEGILTITTHKGSVHTISCTKSDNETFRLGGTNTQAAWQAPCVVAESVTSDHRLFQVALPNGKNMIATGISYYNDFHDGDAAFVVEYYPLDMEGKQPEWLLSRKRIKYPELLFINVDCIDGGGNIIKRYRVSPYFGTVKVFE